ncbi:hypothetical protein ACFO0N_09290 [Halobium salinum]|uniref:Lipoprotein n=1 Tax=Halobium salinum TaxID=1364940 RepID=A0ABD5PBF6_9EURY|nr:hypothetical protein [Halobium salinum]
MSTPRLAVALAVLAVLGGCAGAPQTSTPEADATVLVSNDGDTAYRASVFVVTEPLDGVRVAGANGTNRTFDVERLAAVPPVALGNATAVEPLDDGRRVWRVTVQPETGVSKSFADVPANATVVWSLRRAGAPSRPLRGWGTVTCGAEAGKLRLDVRVSAAGPVSADVTCRSAPS